MHEKLIYQFIWPWQESFRFHLQYLARSTLEQLGAPEDAEVFLVGARRPGSDNINLVCIEPEKQKWPLALFDGLLDSVESILKTHRLQTMLYGDELSMRDKPEWMRRDSVRSAVASAVTPYDISHLVTSFFGEARQIGDYYVTPVLQIPNATFVKFPALPHRESQSEWSGPGHRGLIHAAMHAVLNEGTQEMEKPEPGRNTQGSMREADEIVRLAARSLLHTPGLSIERRYIHTDLFDDLNMVSSLLYEGASGVGQLLLVHPDNENIDFIARFVKPVPFREPRWVRKVLQMASEGVGVIADSQHIHGLGRLKTSHDPAAQDAFAIDFVDHYHWELRCGDQVLMRARYGLPNLPQEVFNRQAFIAAHRRIFAGASATAGEQLWNILQEQTRMPHGSMIVVAQDAISEAARLGKQGTLISPVLLTTELFRSVSGIDGTILLDPNGICHAFGVILDGEATDECTPSRGSRFNSAVRYVYSANRQRMAIVTSDDKTVDIIPSVRDLMSEALIEHHVKAFETACLDTYHEPRNWLDKKRFYINADQCTRINCAMDRFEKMPREVGEIWVTFDRFTADSEFDPSYLTK